MMAVILAFKIISHPSSLAGLIPVTGNEVPGYRSRHEFHVCIQLMVFADFSAHMGPQDRIIFFIMIGITVPADVYVGLCADIVKIRFRF